MVKFFARPNSAACRRFLKVIYENFHKANNPKGADRLGIAYTPGEIVDFMIRFNAEANGVLLNNGKFLDGDDFIACDTNNSQEVKKGAEVYQRVCFNLAAV